MFMFFSGLPSSSMACAVLFLVTLLTHLGFTLMVPTWDLAAVSPPAKFFEVVSTRKPRGPMGCCKSTCFNRPYLSPRRNSLWSMAKSDLTGWKLGRPSLIAQESRDNLQNVCSSIIPTYSNRKEGWQCPLMPTWKRPEGTPAKWAAESWRSKAMQKNSWQNNADWARFLSRTGCQQPEKSCGDAVAWQVCGFHAVTSKSCHCLKMKLTLVSWDTKV